MNRSNLLCLLNEAARTKLPEQVARVKGFFKSGSRVSASQWPPPDYPAIWPYMPDLPEAQKSWAITEAFIDEMKQECDRHGAEFWVVIFAEGDTLQIHPDLGKRAAMARRLGIPSLDESDRRIERFGAAHGIRVLPLAQPLGDYAASHHAALSGQPGMAYASGHWNELGHRVAAGVLSDALLADSPTVARWLGKSGRPGIGD
jgi:hypothetical protein